MESIPYDYARAPELESSVLPGSAAVPVTSTLLFAYILYILLCKYRESQVGES